MEIMTFIGWGIALTLIFIVVKSVLEDKTNEEDEDEDLVINKVIAIDRAYERGACENQTPFKAKAEVKKKAKFKNKK